MRTMVDKNGNRLNVIAHIILTNFWEYYVTDDKFNDDTYRCLVLGDCTEIGDVYLPEIVPYIVSKTKKLKSVMPAPGYIWED